MYIKTSTGYKKKLIVKSIAFTHQKIKNSEKETSSEESENCIKRVPYSKWVSTPLNLNPNIKFDRNINIPIRQSNLDDSVSDDSDNDLIMPKIPGISGNKTNKYNSEFKEWTSANIFGLEREAFTQINSPV